MTDVPPEQDNIAEFKAYRDRAKENLASADGLQKTANDRTFAPVSDAPTRGEIDAKVAAAEARTDTKFAEFRGDVKAISTKLDDLRSGQRTTLWSLAGLIVAALAIAVAVQGFGAQWFGLGLQSHDVLAQAAKQGAEQALAERPPQMSPAASAATSKPVP